MKETSAKEDPLKANRSLGIQIPSKKVGTGVFLEGYYVPSQKVAVVGSLGD